jgi:hypothetical protein
MVATESLPARPRAAFVLRTWRYLLWACFGVWWGGLTFYAAVVVPIGTSMVGSIEQGFITQQVTWWHNGLSTVITIALLLEALRLRSGWLLGGGVMLFVVTLLLVMQHHKLTSMMDFADHTVPDSFYAEHAWYLWLTTGEWGLGALVAACWIRSEHRVVDS